MTKHIKLHLLRGLVTTSLFPLLGGIGFIIHTLATQFLHNDYPFRYLFLKVFYCLIFFNSGAVFWKPIALNEVPIIAALVGFGI